MYKYKVIIHVNKNLKWALITEKELCAPFLICELTIAIQITVNPYLKIGNMKNSKI